MRMILSVYVPALFFVAVSLMLYLWKAPLQHLSHTMAGHDALSYTVFVIILALATVFMPVSAMPIIPVAAMLFGPFVTGVLSVLGWTVGGMLAFLLARTLGRPLIGRFVSLERVDAYAKRISPKAQFWFVVLLRLTLPVDVVSYVIGLFGTISFWSYTAATFLGVLFFSFAFSYLGAALAHGNVQVVLALGAVSLAIFAAGWYTVLRQKGTT